jgi:hypothetical protein
MTSTLLVLPKKHAEYWGTPVLRGLITFIFLTFYALSAQAEYEQATDLQAKSILKPELLKGKNFTVQDNVKNDGLFNHYTVETSFGSFEADSTLALKILINEINAIANMKAHETDDAAIAALKQSGENTVAGAKQLLNSPQETVKGAASGVSGLFNRAKETVGKREIGDAEDGKFEQLVGISKSKGKIASKYGVNVYSQNKVLQEELTRLGQADFLGGLGVGVATSFVPGVGGLVLSTSGTARLLNEAINTTPASELWLQNKNKLIAMGMNADIVQLFLNNPSFSPAESTVLVTALESMKDVDNLDLFIQVALQAADPSMASLITRIAAMTAAYHQNIASLKTVTPVARLTQGVRKDGARILVLPTDYMIWSKQFFDGVTASSGDKKESRAELWVLGTLSKQAAVNIQELGWEIHTKVGSELFPDQN